MKKVYTCILFLSLLAFSGYSQESPLIDSLERVLLNASNDGKPAILNQLSEIYLEKNPKQSLSLAQEALRISKNINNKKHIAESHLSIGNAKVNLRQLNEALNHYDTSLQVIGNREYPEIRANVLSSMGSIEGRIGNRAEAIKHLKKSLEISQEIDYYFGLKKSLNQLGINHFYLSDYDEAIKYFNQQYELGVQEKDTSIIAGSLSALGICYKTKGDLSNAINNYMKALDISEKQGQPQRVALNLFNIATLYKQQKLYDEALNFYMRALKVFNKENDKSNVALSYNNIGTVYQAIAESKQDSLKGIKEVRDDDEPALNDNINLIYDTALVYYEKSLELMQEINDSLNLVHIYTNIGSISKNRGNYAKSIREFETALKIARNSADKMQIANILYNIGDSYLEESKFTLALDYFEESLEITKEIGVKDPKHKIYQGLSEVYEKRNNYKLAYENYRQYSMVKDSIYNEETQRTINEMKEKYESEKKEQQLKIQEINIEKQQATIRQQRTLNIAVGFGAILLLAFLIFAFYQIRIVKKKNTLLAEKNFQINQQKEEIEAQKDEIEAQRDLVFKQKEEITSSIHYAERIQRAVLPSDELAERILPEHFILFRPRDIVSGDYYWMTKKNGKVIAVAADSTGHGVPGAFMSMLGVSFLNEIVNKLEEPEAHIILNQLRNYVKTTLDQTGKEGEAKDGMDIALTILDFENMSVEYAGAYNPLYIIRDGEVLERKADKMPIGIYIKEKESFTRNVIPLQKNDTIYIFSDGFVDQFGGEQGRKYMSKPFKRLLTSMQDKSMAEQREILDKEVDDWRGEIPQLDDIIIIGIRV